MLFVRIFCRIKPGLKLRLVPLHPIAASDSLAIEFALDGRSAPQLGSVPEAIHFTGAVLGELR